MRKRDGGTARAEDLPAAGVPAAGARVDIGAPVVAGEAAAAVQVESPTAGTDTVGTARQEAGDRRAALQEVRPVITAVGDRAAVPAAVPAADPVAELTTTLRRKQPR